MLEVFSTSRAIRSFYTHFSHTNALLPKAMTIQELEQKAILVSHKTLIDDDTRVLLMQEASKFSSFESLHIEREFLVFLRNSQYLFRFFEELSYEKVCIEDLMVADTYESYAEHLNVLAILLKNYTTLLEKNNFYDKITLPSSYTINEAYIEGLGGIRLHLEGFLSQFELELLTKIATLTPLHVSLNITDYNQKMVDVFQNLGCTLLPNHHYEIDLSTQTILHVSPLKSIDANQEVYGFTNRLIQIAYAQSCIEGWINEGMHAEDIVVILPDESFANSLKVFDKLGNLNFAMGISLRESHFYQHLSAIEKALRFDAIEDKLRLIRLNIDEQILFTCKELWAKKVTADEAFDVFEKLLAMDAKEQQEPLFQEAFFNFRHFLTHSIPLRFEQIIKLFLSRLQSLSRDDVRGGKVTVLGVLETRGVAYKGVIVLDFNDDFVPRRSQKDLFLSSTVRSHAKLPTKKDRENLQRYYYHQLFLKAYKIAITYVHNESSMPSRFLDELGFQAELMSNESLFYPLLFESHQPKSRYDVEFIDESYDLSQNPLSATKLKILLTCKRQFYFRYVAMLKEAQMPSNTIDESVVGRYLHKALERAFEGEFPLDAKHLEAQIAHYLKEENSFVVWHYFADMWMERLSGFVRNEMARHEDGYSIAHKELSLKTPYKGFVLEGQIDRIDERGDKLFIIDYKSGKIPSIKEADLAQCVDFQLEFYALLAQQLGTVGGLFYYDLKEGVLVEEAFLEEKLALFENILETFKTPISGFEKCESLKSCKFCPYVVLCGREELV